MIESGYSFERFVATCQDVTGASIGLEPAEIVLRLMPHMQKLLSDAPLFMKPEHFKGSSDKYTRNLIYRCPQSQFSIFSMVWEPGQWTPIHDHGTWGVVGVLEGIFEEQNFLYFEKDKRLVRGNQVILTQGSISTFLPNPDHIHQTGVSGNNQRAVTLHLYGCDMSTYNTYELESGIRSRVELDCQEEGHI